VWHAGPLGRTALRRTQEPRFPWVKLSRTWYLSHRPTVISWSAPFIVVALLKLADLELVSAELLIAMTLAPALFAVVAARPVRALQALIVLAPFHLLALAVLTRLGMPEGLVSRASYWKELLVLGLLFALQQRRQGGRLPFDRAAWLFLGFVALGLVYLLVPQLFTEHGAEIAFADRLVVFRSIVGPAVVLLAARQLRLDARELSTVVRTAVAVAVAVGAIAVLEFCASDLWNSFATDLLHISRPSDVLAGQQSVVDDIRVYGDVAGRSIVRLGGPYFESLAFSFALIGMVALAADVALQRASPRAMAATALTVFALLATQTRSAIAGGLVALTITAVRPRRGVSRDRRVRGLAALGIAAVIALPLVLSSGLSDRLFVGDAVSDAAHRSGTAAARELIAANPLGLGFGYGTSGAQIGGTSYLIPENQYYDIGVQMGIGGMLLFVGAGLAAMRSLYRSSTSDSPEIAMVAGGALAMAAGLALTYRYLQPLILFSVSWPQFAILGAVLGAAASRRSGVQERNGRGRVMSVVREPVPAGRLGTPPLPPTSAPPDPAPDR